MVIAGYQGFNSYQGFSMFITVYQGFSMVITGYQGVFNGYHGLSGFQ